MKETKMSKINKRVETLGLKITKIGNGIMDIIYKDECLFTGDKHDIDRQLKLYETFGLFRMNPDYKENMNIRADGIYTQNGYAFEGDVIAEIPFRINEHNKDKYKKWFGQYPPQNTIHSIARKIISIGNEHTGYVELSDGEEIMRGSNYLYFDTYVVERNSPTERYKMTSRVIDIH